MVRLSLHKVSKPGLVPGFFISFSFVWMMFNLLNPLKLGS